jgi:hypothetical protein
MICSPAAQRVGGARAAGSIDVGVMNWANSESRTEAKMDPMRGRNVDFWLRLEDGGKAKEPRTHAERELERAVRELFYAMEGKGKNLRNVAEGITFPARMLIRRFKEAKRARRDSVNYRLVKQTVRAIDAYADALFGRTETVDEYLAQLRQDITTTGDYPKQAA